MSTYWVRFAGRHVTCVVATDTYAAILTALDKYHARYREYPYLPVEVARSRDGLDKIPHFEFPTAEKFRLTKPPAQSNLPLPPSGATPHPSGA